MDSRKEVQHVYLVGAKSLGAYGGYETFVYKLTEYHQNKENIKYHVACKANGDGCMDENKFEGVTKINDHELNSTMPIALRSIFHRSALQQFIMMLQRRKHVVNISGKTIFLIRLFYIMACRIGPFAGHFL